MQLKKWIKNKFKKKTSKDGESYNADYLDYELINLENNLQNCLSNVVNVKKQITQFSENITQFLNASSKCLLSLSHFSHFIKDLNIGLNSDSQTLVKVVVKDKNIEDQIYIFNEDLNTILNVKISPSLKTIQKNAQELREKFYEDLHPLIKNITKQENKIKKINDKLISLDGDERLYRKVKTANERLLEDCDLLLVLKKSYKETTEQYIKQLIMETLQNLSLIFKNQTKITSAFLDSEAIIQEFSRLSESCSMNLSKTALDSADTTQGEDENMSEDETDDVSSTDLLENSKGSRLSKRYRNTIFFTPTLPPKPSNISIRQDYKSNTFLAGDHIYDIPVSNNSNSLGESSNDHFSITYNTYANGNIDLTRKTQTPNNISFRVHHKAITPMKVPIINRYDSFSYTNSD